MSTSPTEIDFAAADPAAIFEPWRPQPGQLVRVLWGEHPLPCPVCGKEIPLEVLRTLDGARGMVAFGKQRGTNGAWLYPVRFAAKLQVCCASSDWAFFTALELEPA